MPTGVLFVQVLVVLGVALCGVWVATQWTAAALGYQAQLGQSWFGLWGTPIYRPWQLFEWWYFFDAYAPAIFLRGGAIAASSGVAAAGAGIGMAVWRSRQARRVTTHGSARWAELDEIVRAELTGGAGVFLGRLASAEVSFSPIKASSRRVPYLRHNGPEHVMAFAPTRSGKGVGLVIPTLLTWPGSAVIHDIKGENDLAPVSPDTVYSQCNVTLDSNVW